MAFLVKLYQNTLSILLSLLFGRGCRFIPTCSEYAKEAIQEFGIKKGTVLSLKRLAKCHPWGSHGYDPIPTKD